MNIIIAHGKLTKKLPNGTTGQLLKAETGKPPVWTSPSGTYTPTLTRIENVDTPASALATYIQIGNVVLVTGQISVTPTANNTVTILGFSLPIASNFTSLNQANGTASALTIAESGGFQSDGSEDVVNLSFLSATDTEHTISYTFSYLIV